MSRTGIVSIVGAGPGDPELITIRGKRRLEHAEVVVHDRLVARELIESAPASARRIDVGKSPGQHRWTQRRINALLVAEARRGRRVVRLKGGDPFVFGRGAEECEALVVAGIPFEVIPGVSAAVAAPAYAGIPVTHRRHASAFTVVTGHRSGDDPGKQDWATLARSETLVVLMGLSRLREITKALMIHGCPADRPVAVISRASDIEQAVVRGTLRDIPRRVTGLRGPATVIVGEVVDLAKRLAWFEPQSETARDVVA